MLSFKQNWSDLRFTSFVILSLILISYISKFARAENRLIPLIFVIVFFVLFHISALINSIKNPKDNLSILDSISIVGFAIVFLLILYRMFDWNPAIYGLFVMAFSIIYLGEIFYFKSTHSEHSHSLIYSLLGTGIAILNLGFFFLMDIMDFQYLTVFFAVEYVIFSFISQKSKEKSLYSIASSLCLALITIFYALGIFRGGEILRSTIMLIVYFCIVISFIYLFKKNVNFKINAVAFVIGGFLFIFYISRYLLLFNITNQMSQITLSVLWLIYTLVLFMKVESKEGKWLVGVLLGITLIKIALRDLLYLKGVYRIIGFIIFGILLLVGGYLVNRSEKNAKNLINSKKVKNGKKQI
jgi:uncharacterized membrane protein